jgi:hypothetical protein
VEKADHQQEPHAPEMQRHETLATVRPPPPLLRDARAEQAREQRHELVVDEQVHQQRRDSVGTRPGLFGRVSQAPDGVGDEHTQNRHASKRV